MANKIYDFLPAHLQNKELADIFDATLERVFSKGDLEKVRAYVGRREKGMNNNDDRYLEFPEHLFQRDNYGLEPVFVNSNINDRVFYDDLLNAMYNKGMLVNDHRRLFESDRKTINLPIDADKFVNWQLYYWVKPLALYRHVFDGEFAKYESDGTTPILERVLDENNNQVYVSHKNLVMTSNNKPEYITIDDGAENYWSKTNSWYHHEDIRHLMSNERGYTRITNSEHMFSVDVDQTFDYYYVKTDNTDLFAQAQRPIIEFDRDLEVLNDVTEWEVPKFKLFDEDGVELEGGSTIFEYVQDELFTPDPVLGIDVKVKSGDYNSEFVFQITIPDGATYKLLEEEHSLYIDTEFNYRNLRREYGITSINEFDLPQSPKSNSDIDVYVDGIKQINNYTVENNTVYLNKELSDNDVYIDYCTKDPVDVDGDRIWQRIDPIIEFNVDNETHNFVEFTYSVFYEHFIRQIETTTGLTGEANALNNYRTLQAGSKTKFNKFGSVMVVHNVDINKGYFAITRDDYDPIKSIEFLSNAYASYKNKFILKVQELLKEDEYYSKTNIEIFETAISEIASLKRENINVFTGSKMINFGELFNHYDEGSLEITLGGFEHRVSENIDILSLSTYPENSMVIVNDRVMRYNEEYIISGSGRNVIFTNYMVQPDDIVTIRYYEKIAETYIPPSSTSLGISPLYVPGYFTDEEYDTPVTFIRGHDGSSIPSWGDRTDDILMIFENLIYSKNTDKSTEKTELDLLFNSSDTEYTFAEKRYTVFPFFKKWLIKNNIDDIRNTIFDVNDWKTWNYRALSDDIPGSWRSILSFVYGTEFIFSQPWLVLGVTERPRTELFGWVEDPSYELTGGYFIDKNFKSFEFWTELKSLAGATWPIPVDSDGNLREILDMFSLSSTDTNILRQDWEFGDGSPEELAWKRNSEYPFIEFALKILLKPFKMLDVYDSNIEDIVRFYNKREGYNTSSIVSEREGYEFKLGSKFGGFVNNFKLFSERNSFSNSSKSEIPSDNYELFIHSGEPNRTESFSAIVIEKVSLDEQYPYYSILDTGTYTMGDIVLRQNDGKYYRRKVDSQTQNEQDRISEPAYFDYSAWVLVSQPNVKKFGYRVSGYDDFNPVFATLDWDKTSGMKRWSSDGDLANIKQWTAGEYYRNDFYSVYNNKAYISLDEHQASESFDNDLADGKWKLLRDWPLVNTVDALGYKEVLPDQLKFHNYGDILETLDDVAQLFVGYQEYLKAVGWDFTDIDEFSEVVDFETLLVEFLNWSREKRGVGEYIVLTPVIKSGKFDTPYGVASITSNTNKNFYNVVDVDGRQINKDNVKFNMQGGSILWESTVPIYGIKMEIRDIEHAIVIDREDSFGDVIYNPLTHDRNLRMLIDCNRTKNWDGTLAADGYIATNTGLTPNFETMIEDTRYYRDTLVDQSLEIINKLKEGQLSFVPRTYLTNHFIDRESQVEFHKGFLAGKGIKNSIDRIINKNSNFSDNKHDEVWAFKIDEYGKTKNKDIVTKSIKRSEINSDPFVIRWEENNKFKINSDKYYRTTPIMTSGYVDPDDVNYVVRNSSILESTVRDTFYEGDLAWIRFDDDREWDVKRLSEIAEIAYIGETEDGQLYVGLTNEVSIDDPVFLKINSVEVDPTVNGYFNLVDDGEKIQNGQTVYEYLVFDNDYEPFIVEIDETTNNSVYVPTPDDSGVEAIGSVSNPNFVNGERLSINGNVYVYNSSTDSSTFGITIGGEGAITDPFITTGEEARIVVYDENNNILNSDTDVRFGGTRIDGDGTVNSVKGDIIKVNGVSINIDYSSQTSITATSGVDIENIFESGLILTLTNGVDTSQVESKDIEIKGTLVNPTIATTKTLYVNDIPARFEVPDPIIRDDTTETHPLEITPVTSIDLQNDMRFYEPGVITVDNGVDPVYEIQPDDYEIVGNTITFNNPILAGLVDHDNDVLTDEIPDPDGTVNILVNLKGIPVPQVLDINDIVSTINAIGAPITAVIDNNKINIETGASYIELSGGALVDLGLHTSDYLVKSKLIDINEQLQQVSFISSSIDNNNKLNITTDDDYLLLGGELATVLGFNPNEYDATTNPTATSISNQINAASIPSVSSTNVGNSISIVFDGPELTIEEVTSGALSRLGVTNTGGTKTIKAIDTIIADINKILPSNTRAEKYAGTDRVMITSSAKRVEISNYSGNPWDDLGIATGVYINANVNASSVQLFKDQINADATDVTVSVSSDGRMIFTSNSNAITFDGTDENVLSKIGVYGAYTSVKSNANFKIMRWKSVRYTPNYIYESYQAFLTDLGINSNTKIWSDDYRDTGWAVLNYDTVSSVPSIIARQVHDIVDVEDTQRMIVKDNETFYTYQLFDPLSMKIPGSIDKDIDYVDWQDPAKYDDEYSNDLWLAEHEGEIWWDTKSARYYRYKDYGDKNGNINVDYVKRYWGKLVPGSSITIKQWKSSSSVPTDITWFNTETRWDTNTNRNITTYYYWSTIGIDVPEKEYSIDEIKMLIESGGVTNKFIPIDDRTIITSNNTLLNADEIEYSVYKRNSRDIENKHVDWHLVSKNSSVAIDDVYLTDLRDSVVGRKVEEVKVFVAKDGQVIFTDELLSGLSVINASVSINSEFVDILNVGFTYVEVDEDSTGKPVEIPALLLDNITITAGDVVRVYKISENVSWFKDVTSARDNFSSIINDKMKHKMLHREFPFFEEHIALGQGILQAENWSISSEYDTIKRYEYLSKTRNFDMIRMYNSGTESFKVDIPGSAEYYFGYKGNLRLVHKENAALRLSYPDTLPNSNSEISKYYENMYSVQTYEFINMLYTYADKRFIKDIFFEMIDYMYTEKTYPDWIFKTSYIDLFMLNKPLRQYAIYQNDNYDDIIDYVNETKPYHTKIRETERVYPYGEVADTDVDIYEAMELELRFGGYSRYKDNIIDGGDQTIQVNDELFGYIFDTYTVRDSIPEGLRSLYEMYSEHKSLINNVRYSNNFELTDEQNDIMNAWNSLVEQYSLDPNNSYEAGGLLRRFNTPTNEDDGYDTGEFDINLMEAMVLKIQDSTIDKTEFHVYDIFGRMYEFPVDSILTIQNFNGKVLVLNDSIRHAKDESQHLIALQNSVGDVEFMLYGSNDIDGNVNISSRAIFNGVASSFNQGDRVYVLGSPKKQL